MNSNMNENCLHKPWSIQRAELYNRLQIKEFVSEIHLQISGINDSARKQQELELYDDFISLFEEKEFEVSYSWICIEKNNNRKKIIGAIGFHPLINENILNLEYFFVDINYQKQGIGRQLLSIAMDYVSHLPFSHLQVTTLRNIYENAYKMYVDYGFEIYESLSTPYFQVVHMKYIQNN